MGTRAWAMSRAVAICWDRTAWWTAGPRIHSAPQPSRADDLHFGGPHACAEAAIRRYQKYGLDRLGGDRRERVVSITWSVDDLYPVSRALLRARSGPTLEHDHDRRGEPAGGRRRPDSLDEIARGAGTVAPPSSWTGTDDVGTIDEQHT